MKRFSTAVEVTSRPNCAAVDWKSVALASGFLSRVRTSIRNKLTAVNFRRRWITPVARPSSSASGPRTFCIVAATLPTISIGKLLLPGPSHGTSSVADSCLRNSSGVILRNSQKLNAGNFRPNKAVRRLILSVPGPELV